MLVYLYVMHSVALVWFGAYFVARYLFRGSVPKAKKIIPPGFLKLKSLFGLLSDDLSRGQKWQVMVAIVIDVLFFAVVVIVGEYYYSLLY